MDVNLNLEEIVENAYIWACAHGMIKRLKPKEDETCPVTFLPFALLPSIYPQKCFLQAKNNQPIINKLYSFVVTSDEFLHIVYEKAAQVDPFVKNLWHIYKHTINKEGIQMGLIRSDYLLHNPACFGQECKPSYYSEFVKEYKNIKDYNDLNVINSKLKMVEVNCIAASFGCISPITSQLHRYNLQSLKLKTTNLPPNDTCQFMANGLVQAWNLYENTNAIILIVIEEFSINEFDQRYLEYEIQAQTEGLAKIFRRSFKQLIASLNHNHTLVFNEKDRTLSLDNQEIAIVYYRTGYSPQDYPDEEAWNLRLIMENCRAIKCPSIQFQLAGTKLVQEYLSTHDLKELSSTFFSSFCHAQNLENLTTSEINRLKDTFVQFYPLDNPTTKEKNIDYAIENSENIVLKPIREGGGNNLYGDDVKEYLTGYRLYHSQLSKSQTTKDDLRSHPYDLPFILMERIKPASVPNYMVRPTRHNNSNTQPDVAQLIGELGIFGVILCSKTQGIISSQSGGLLLRSKSINDNETGIMAGFGALDSPYLI